MNGIARTDTSLLGQWWWTVDRWTLAAVAALMGFGVVLILAASPPVAERIGLDSFELAHRQLVLLPYAVAGMLAVSLLSPLWVRRLAVVGFLGALLVCALTLAIGPQIKGATRWITIAGFSLQPSEFVKPTFAVVAAWMFSLSKRDPAFPGNMISAGLCLLVVAILMGQPDVGQAFVVSAVWAMQVFMAGLPLAWVAVLFYIFLTSVDRNLAVGLFLLPLVLILIISAYFVSDQPNPLLPPEKNLKMAHAALLVFGTVGVILGFVLGLMYLWQHYRLKHKQTLKDGLALPSLERLSRLNWWAVIISVPLLTLGMATGLQLGLISKDSPDPVSFLDPIVVVNGIVWLVLILLNV